MGKRVLILGSGDAGKMVAGELLSNSGLAGRYRLCGFLDDDPGQTGLDGVPVLGPLNRLEEIVHREQIELVIIAIPTATPEQVGRIVDLAAGLPVKLKIVPGVPEIIQGDVYWKQVREFSPADLLGRGEIAFERDLVAPFYEGSVVCITGGGGSIGSELCRQLLQLPVKRVVAVGHGENSLYQLQQEFREDPRLVCELGEVQDRQRMEQVFSTHRVDTVFHAAAHKHVPMMEQFPAEAFRNNVLGTLRTVQAAAAAGVSRFVFVSTDKAVNPSSVMGATKRIAERIVLGYNAPGRFRCAVTRFGNVLGSRGSVIPLFLEQIRRGGPVTVTHRDIERYFMSIPEAARLVVKAGSLHEGVLFVLDMGKPVKIYQLARRMVALCGYTAEEIPIVEIGLRPGEKMYEELLTESEALDKTRFEKLFVSGQQAHACPPAASEQLAAAGMALLAETTDASVWRSWLFEQVEAEWEKYATERMGK